MGFPLIQVQVKLKPATTSCRYQENILDNRWRISIPRKQM